MQHLSFSECRALDELHSVVPRVLVRSAAVPHFNKVWNEHLSSLPMATTKTGEPAKPVAVQFFYAHQSALNTFDGSLMPAVTGPQLHFIVPAKHVLYGYGDGVIPFAIDGKNQGPVCIPVTSETAGPVHFVLAVADRKNATTVMKPLDANPLRNIWDVGHGVSASVPMFEIPRKRALMADAFVCPEVTMTKVCHSRRSSFVSVPTHQVPVTYVACTGGVSHINVQYLLNGFSRRHPLYPEGRKFLTQVSTLRDIAQRVAKQAAKWVKAGHVPDTETALKYLEFANWNGNQSAIPGSSSM